MASEREADKLMKQGEKLLQPSVVSFRFKPSWDDAYPLFEKAATQYKVLGLTSKAIVAYEQAAEANLRAGAGTAWHAARHLEAATQLANEQRKPAVTADLARRSAKCYVDCDKVRNGAEVLSKAAHWLEQQDAELSLQLFTESVDMYTRSETPAMAQDTLQRAVGALVRAKKWGDAASMLMRWAVICSANELDQYVSRAYLGVLVLYLHDNAAQLAWASYQDFLDVPAFSQSPEANAAERLFEAYLRADVNAIQEATKERVFNGLDAQVARLAKALPSDQAALGDIKAYLESMMGVEAAGGAGAEDEDDDLGLT